MKTVTEALAGRGGQSCRNLRCLTASRKLDRDPLEEAASLDADFLSVAYNPGQSVRVNSAFAAKYISDCHGKPTVFTLATRDMNRIAIQSLLLGASWAGLHNVVVVRGDPIRARDRDRVTTVSDYTTTALLADIAAMNRGLDFRGLSLESSNVILPRCDCRHRQRLSTPRHHWPSANSLLEPSSCSAQAHFNFADVRELRRRLSPSQG